MHRLQNLIPPAVSIPRRFPPCFDEVERYVGVPWRELGRDVQACDCFGLLRLVYLEQLGLELPDFGYAIEDRGGQAQLIAAQVRSHWRQVAVGTERPFDAVLMREGRELSHVGIVVGRGLLLHVERGASSVIEPYRRGSLRYRVAGFYRHGAGAE
jgi:cell wall-associated NlpC family hydrolase